MIYNEDIRKKAEALLTITLSVDTEARLRAEAARRRIAADRLMEQLIREAIAGPPEKPGQATIDLFGKWEREDATDDPQETVRRQAEFEHFMREMNATRLSSEGRGARIPFP
jgi:hypothetical protein